MPDAEIVNHPFEFGAIGIGDAFTLLDGDGKSVASGVTGCICYRSDWTVAALVDEVSKTAHPVPPGATVQSLDAGHCIILS